MQCSTSKKAGVLRSNGTGHNVEECRHGMRRHGAGPWHWTLHGYKHLTTGQLKEM